MCSGPFCYSSCLYFLFSQRHHGHCFRKRLHLFSDMTGCLEFTPEGHHLTTSIHALGSILYWGTHMDGLDSTRFAHPKILFVFTFSVSLPNQAFRKKYSYRPKCHNSISMHIMQCNEAINLKPPVNSTSSLNYQPVPSVNGSKNDSNYLMQRPTCTEFSFESHQGSLINWR